MKPINNIFFISLIIFALLYSCSKPEGCLDPNASNYDYDAKKSDGSCLYDMSFYANTIDHLPLYIFINGQLRDSLYCAWLYSEPKCGVDTFIYTSVGYIRCTANVPMHTGSHKVRVESRDGTIWEKTVKLSENCVNVLISGPN